MITIYHLENSRSERIVWLMEELGLPYRLERFQRESNLLAPPAMRKIHPLGKSPMIRDGDHVVVESGAIVEYIITRYGSGKLMPMVESSDYPRYLEWLHASEGSAMAYFLMEAYMGNGDDNSEPWRTKAAIEKSNERYLRYMNDELGKRPYFSGSEFSAADIMMIFVIRLLKGFMKRDLTLYPNIDRYFKQVCLRPAYVKAMAIANPTN